MPVAGRILTWTSDIAYALRVSIRKEKAALGWGSQRRQGNIDTLIIRDKKGFVKYESNRNCAACRFTRSNRPPYGTAPHSEHQRKGLPRNLHGRRQYRLEKISAWMRCLRSSKASGDPLVSNTLRGLRESIFCMFVRRVRDDS